MKYWSDLCAPLLVLVNNLDAAFSSNRVTTEQAKKAIPQFRQIVQAVAAPNKATFSSFAKRVTITQFIAAPQMLQRLLPENQDDDDRNFLVTALASFLTNLRPAMGPFQAASATSRRCAVGRA